MYEEIIKDIKPELQKVIEFLEKEVAKVRTNRVSATLVEDVEVDCFGQNFTLKQLAAISTPKPREIIIQPWDSSYLESIEKALARDKSLQASPIVDGEIIRIALPSLSTEYREILLKLISEKKEESRQTIRRWRQEAWNKIQNLTRDGKIREDDKFRAKDKLKELIDEYNEKVEAIIEKKKKEILE